MTEDTLFPVEPVTIVTLTARQAYVMAELRKADGGLDADEVGALLCERKGRHDRGVRCSWDGANGKSVLNSLRKKGLVKRRRGGTWLALSEPEPPGSSQDGPGGEIPY